MSETKWSDAVRDFIALAGLYLESGPGRHQPDQASRHALLLNGNPAEIADMGAMLFAGFLRHLERREVLGSAEDILHGYDGSIWDHHDGFMWLHLAAPVTVRCGPVSSGSEKKGLVRAGAISS